MTDDSAEILFQPFLREAIERSSGMRQRCSLFHVVHPPFTPPTTGSSTIKSDLNDDFREDVVARNELELCERPSLDGCQKRFPWTHEELRIMRLLWSVCSIEPLVEVWHRLGLSGYLNNQLYQVACPGFCRAIVLKLSMRHQGSIMMLTNNHNMGKWLVPINLRSFVTKRMCYKVVINS